MFTDCYCLINERTSECTNEGITLVMCPLYLFENCILYTVYGRLPNISHKIIMHSMRSYKLQTLVLYWIYTIIVQNSALGFSLVLIYIHADSNRMISRICAFFSLIEKKRSRNQRWEMNNSKFHWAPSLLKTNKWDHLNRSELFKQIHLNFKNIGKKIEQKSNEEWRSIHTTNPIFCRSFNAREAFKIFTMKWRREEKNFLNSQQNHWKSKPNKQKAMRNRE